MKESKLVKKYKLIDYPHCAICINSEQYDDNTFICMYDEGNESYNPAPNKDCDVFNYPDEIGIYYLSSFLELIIKKIKRLETKNKKLKKEIRELKKVI